MIMLVHPTTGVVQTAPNYGFGFRDLVLDGFEPVGPNAKAAAQQVRSDRLAALRHVGQPADPYERD